ncbi:hypothetical protein SFRURICE_007109 [Spodoptera frugiperda]|nr:hypothetical protein SFRURICE_007109 [Spodoptera frugiperda]
MGLITQMVKSGCTLYSGIRGPTNMWFRTYLNERTIQTSLAGITGREAGVALGVPTGSVFGPVGYIMHVNSVANVYLGLWVDSHANWRTHVDTVCTKLRTVLSKFYVLKAPLKTLRIVYFALVESLIGYGLSVYGRTFKSYLDNIKSLQIRFLKYLVPPKFKQKCKQNYEKLYIPCKILPVHDRAKYFLILEQFYSQQNKEKVTNKYNTRRVRENKLVRPPSKNYYGSRTNKYLIPTLYNKNDWLRNINNNEELYDDRNNINKQKGKQHYNFNGTYKTGVVNNNASSSHFRDNYYDNEELYDDRNNINKQSLRLRRQTYNFNGTYKTGVVNNNASSSHFRDNYYGNGTSEPSRILNINGGLANGGASYGSGNGGNGGFSNAYGGYQVPANQGWLSRVLGGIYYQ